MEEPLQPRYEFRIFSNDPIEQEQILRRQGRNEQYKESGEVYLPALSSNSSNVKIRFGLLDVKMLINIYEGLELWYPVYKTSFPLTSESLAENLLPLWGMDEIKLEKELYSEEDFHREVIAHCEEVVAVSVIKKRSTFLLHECICECAEVIINNKSFYTMAIESELPRKIHEAKTMLDLNSYENLNYLKFIKKVNHLY